jgi:hypothetical protein
MSKTLKTIITVACLAAAAVANAKAPDEEYSNGILLCDAGSSFARFGAVMGDSSETLAQKLSDAGCINHLDHKSKGVVASTAKGVRFERVAADIKSRLVRIVGADGSVIGYAEYRGYMYPPAQRAAVDAIFAAAK